MVFDIAYGWKIIHFHSLWSQEDNGSLNLRTKILNKSVIFWWLGPPFDLILAASMSHKKVRGKSRHAQEGLAKL